MFSDSQFFKVVRSRYYVIKVLSKLKAIVDDKLNVMKFVLDIREKIVGKGEEYWL